MSESVLYVLGDRRQPPPVYALQSLFRQRKTRQELLQLVPDFDGYAYFGRCVEERFGNNYGDHAFGCKATTWGLADYLGDDLHIWRLGVFDDGLHGNLEAWITRLAIKWEWTRLLYPNQKSPPDIPEPVTVVPEKIVLPPPLPILSFQEICCRSLSTFAGSPVRSSELLCSDLFSFNIPKTGGPSAGRQSGELLS